MNSRRRSLTGVQYDNTERDVSYAYRLRGIRVGSWVNVIYWADDATPDGALNAASPFVVVAISKMSESANTFRVADEQGRTRWAYKVDLHDADPGKILTERVVTIQQDHRAKMEEIGQKAMDLAAEHDWCEVVSAALAEMDVPVPAKSATLRFSVEINVDDISPDLQQRINYSKDGHGDDEWICNTYSFDRLEGDRDGGEVTDVSVTLESAELNE